MIRSGIQRRGAEKGFEEDRGKDSCLPGKKHRDAHDAKDLSYRSVSRDLDRRATRNDERRNSRDFFLQLFAGWHPD